MRRQSQNRFYMPFVILPKAILDAFYRAIQLARICALRASPCKIDKECVSIPLQLRDNRSYHVVLLVDATGSNPGLTSSLAYQSRIVTYFKDP